MSDEMHRKILPEDARGTFIGNDVGVPPKGGFKRVGRQRGLRSERSFGADVMGVIEAFDRWQASDAGDDEYAYVCSAIEALRSQVAMSVDRDEANHER